MVQGVIQHSLLLLLLVHCSRRDDSSLQCCVILRPRHSVPDGLELLQRLHLDAVRVQLVHVLEDPGDEVVSDDDAGVVHLLLEGAMVVQLVDVLDLRLPVVEHILDGVQMRRVRGQALDVVVHTSRRSSEESLGW